MPSHGMHRCDHAITRADRSGSGASDGHAIRACTAVARHQFGLTLLEALIALLVLAVGLLGFMGLQVRGLAYNHDAYVRSMATVLAHDMIERVRMARANAPNEAALTQIYDALTTGVAAGAVCQPVVAAPNHAARVAGEKICWEAQVQATLPAGVARIDRRAGANAGSPLDDIFTITLEWRDRTAPNGQPVTQVWEFQP